MSDPAVIVESLRKAYGSVTALDGVSFEVQRGGIFGLVGPNGADKSTTLRIMSTLLGADSGRVVTGSAGRLGEWLSKLQR